jgi:hypothetical protein
LNNFKVDEIFYYNDTIENLVKEELINNYRETTKNFDEVFGKDKKYFVSLILERFYGARYCFLTENPNDIKYLYNKQDKYLRCKTDVEIFKKFTKSF